MQAESLQKADSDSLCATPYVSSAESSKACRLREDLALMQLECLLHYCQCLAGVADLVSLLYASLPEMERDLSVGVSRKGHTDLHPRFNAC
jgi:hypothetical protein